MSVLQDYFNTGDDNIHSIKATAWAAQIFTATASYSIRSIKVLVYATANPGTVTISIRNVSGSPQTAVPTGNDLVSGSADGSGITSDTAGEWFEITLDSPYSIVSGNKYALCLRCSNTDFSLRWRNDGDAGYITGNAATSSDTGANWTAASTRDEMFETYSADPVYEDLEATGGGAGDGIADLSFIIYENMSATGGGEGDGTAILSTTVFKNLISTGGGTSSALAKMLSRVTMSDVVQRKRVVAVGNNQVWYGDVE